VRWQAWRDRASRAQPLLSQRAMTPSAEQLAKQIDLALKEREALLEDLDEAARELGWLQAELRVLERKRLTRWRRLLDWVSA